MSGPSVAVVDNYDSFTWNLVQYLAVAGARPTVHRNDRVTVAELAAHDAVVVSPGPGGPDDAGVSVAAIRALTGVRPLLGVCLGHQCIAAAAGARVVRGEPVHGHTSPISHDGDGVFAGLPDGFPATRYHSLVVDPASLPDDLVPTAWTGDVLMGLRHRRHPVFGVQFHPESVLTDHGADLLTGFLRTCDPETDHV